MSSLASLPRRGSATVDTATNRITYTPRADCHGADALAFAFAFEMDDDGQITVASGVTFDASTQDTYTVTVGADDGNGGTASVDVTITVAARPTRAPAIFAGGGGGPPPGPEPSDEDFEWTVSRDIEALDDDHGSPTGMWSDGTTLWLADNAAGAGDAVYAYDLASGERLETVSARLRARLDEDRRQARLAGAPSDSAPWYRWYYSPWDQADLRDDRLVLLADRLPRGVHEYVYYARATTPGNFFVSPARAQEAYFPEVFGRSDSGRFTVVAGE